MTLKEKEKERDEDVKKQQVSKETKMDEGDS